MLDPKWTTEAKIAHGNMLRKPMFLPHLDSFGDFFVKSDIDPATTPKLDRYLHIRDMREGAKQFQAMHVQPSDELYQFLGTMAKIPNDTIFFHIVIWNDNDALLIAEYNQILGPTWLSIIDTQSIPHIVHPVA